MVISIHNLCFFFNRRMQPLLQYIITALKAGRDGDFLILEIDNKIIGKVIFFTACHFQLAGKKIVYIQYAIRKRRVSASFFIFLEPLSSRGDAAIWETVNMRLLFIRRAVMGRREYITIPLMKIIRLQQ